jgi:tRNA1(Val) A37 N6-methylase TrmN6
MRRGLGGLTVFPLWPGGAPAANGNAKPAKRVIVSGRKGIAAPLILLPGLTLHTAEGTYTEAAERVLRDGGALGS